MPVRGYWKKIRKEGFDNRWIDVYQNEGKRSPARTPPAPRSIPFVPDELHGHPGQLIHWPTRWGHAIHSYLSNRTQSH